MENIDFTQWPWWAIATLLILNLFKTPLGNLFPSILGVFSAKATSKAEIEEIIAEGHRQDEVTEKLMLSSFVKQLLARNQELIEFLQNVVVNRLDTMDERLIDILREHRHVREVYEKAVNGE